VGKHSKVFLLNYFFDRNKASADKKGALGSSAEHKKDFFI